MVRPDPLEFTRAPGVVCCFSPYACCRKEPVVDPAATVAVTAAPDPVPRAGVRPRVRPARPADRMAARRRSQRRRRRADRRAAHRRAARRPVLQRERDPARRPGAGPALAGPGPRVLRRPERAAADGGERVLLGGLREGVPRPGRPGPVRLRPAGWAASAPGPAHARRPGRRRAGAGADHHELRHPAGGRHPPGAGPGRGRAADRPGPGVIEPGRVHAGHRRPPAADEDPRRPGRRHGQEHHRGAGPAGRAAPPRGPRAAQPVRTAGRRVQRPRPGRDSDAPRRPGPADPLPGRPDLGPAPRGRPWPTRSATCWPPPAPPGWSRCTRSRRAG